MKVEITKDCYIIFYIGMGNVDIIPELCKKGKIYEDVGCPEDKVLVTTEELKEELRKYKVGTAFLEGTDYEYECVMVQAPHSALVPVGCFKIIK
jgi:hypothetical protein